jgi:hypothetical protein
MCRRLGTYVSLDNFEGLTKNIKITWAITTVFRVGYEQLAATLLSCRQLTNARASSCFVNHALIHCTQSSYHLFHFAPTSQKHERTVFLEYSVLMLIPQRNLRPHAHVTTFDTTVRRLLQPFVTMKNKVRPGHTLVAKDHIALSLSENPSTLTARFE